jgi:hypothetical protein
MYAKAIVKSLPVLLAVGVLAAGTSLTGCGKNETGVSKSESERLHAPLGQPMPPQAREALAKAMSKRGGAPAPAAPAAPAAPK